jgi:hypothetical protein
MATNRFFYLPWQVHPTIAAAVGNQTRWPESPNFNDPYPSNTYYWNYNKGRSGDRTQPPLGNQWNEVLDTHPMQIYAVTQDPDLVPLSVTAMDALSPLSNQNLDYAMQPSYTYWTGAWTDPATYFTSTMGVPWPQSPDLIHDSRGPISFIKFGWPWAKSVYQLQGVTSITGSQFVCAGYQQYQNVQPLWIRNSLEAQHTYIPQTTMTGFGPFNTCPFTSSLHPYCIYVLRPSTGAIVGWLAYDTFWVFNGTVNSPSDGATGLPTAILDIKSDQWYYTYGSYGDVNGIQDGDLIVWEWWQFNQSNVWSLSDAQVARPKVVNWRSHMRTHWGGGLAGQPLTNDGVTGFPNWAPAHRSEVTVSITGIEPVYITSVRTTNISASLGSVSGSTGLTVVN